MKIWRGILLGLVGLMLFSCSKSKDKIPVAKIKDRVITLAKFEETYNKVDPRFLPDAEGFDRLRKFLDTMVDKEVMAIKADDLGYDKDETVKSGMDAFRKLGFHAAYLKFRVSDKVVITDEKLRDYYNKLGTTITMKQILVDTKAEADEVCRLLKEGNDFDSVCKQYSKGPDASEGGKAMTATFGRFQTHLQDVLFEQPVGGITEPIESMYGYFVVKVLKINKPKHRQTFEQMKSEIKPNVQRLEEVRLMNARSEEIRRRAGMEWYPENIRIVFDALPPDRPLTNPPPRDEEVYPLLKFDEPDLEKTLVSYNDKAMTIRDFSDFYDRKSFFERPRREFRFGGIKRMMMEIIMVELVEDEVQRSKVEDIPELQELLRLKQEELMVTRMFEELISNQTVVTLKERREYYEDNKERYKLPEQRRFGIVVTGDNIAAQEAYDKLVGGMPLARVAQFYSIDEATRTNLGETDLLTKGGQPELDDVGFSLKNVGDISTPFQTARGWVVLKLVEKSPERIRTYEEVENAIVADLRNLKNDSRLKELMVEWKKDVPVEIFEDNLKKADLDELAATK